ncbi:MAG: glycosyltransferase family 39 protein [Candidatus Buchananbacteria bacterium]|nr:glycosyltransferase family 39 protein [Candidatus Buchananbacteria bacterium]
MKKRKIAIFLGLILLLATLLRFWGIVGSDLKHDAAINSVRAFGWFDFLAGVGQTSPLVWFGSIPWWANLSFHDHPPLVFLIQRIFFAVFGDSVLVALLPFLLGGVILTFLIYYFVSKFKDKKTGLMASFIFAFSSYSVWLSRTGYLEGVEILFVALSIFFLISFIYSNKNKFLFFWALTLGLALISKYTAIFLIPASLVTFLIYKRSTFKQKKFYLSLLLILVILSPVIFYNYQVFITRGHFDAALSSMVGMHPEDFSVISSRGVNDNFGSNSTSIFNSLWAISSQPFSWLFILSIVYFLFKLFKKRSDVFENILAINFLFLLLMFLFAGPAVRFLSLATIFIDIFVAILLVDIFMMVNEKKWLKYSLISLLVLVFGFEFFYSINTNILIKPIGTSGLYFSSARFYETGFDRLEQYLKQNVFSQKLQKKRITKLIDGQADVDLKAGQIILFDERVNWFPRMWHIDKYIHYYHQPLVFFSDLDRTVPGDQDMIGYLADYGVKDFWLVAAGPAGIAQTDNQSYNELLDNLEQYLSQAGVEPIEEIKNWDNQVSFKIYHFQTK